MCAIVSGERSVIRPTMIQPALSRESCRRVYNWGARLMSTRRNDNVVISRHIVLFFNPIGSALSSSSPRLPAVCRVTRLSHHAHGIKTVALNYKKKNYKIPPLTVQEGPLLSLTLSLQLFIILLYFVFLAHSWKTRRGQID